MRHALILLPVLTLGATATHLTAAQAAPDFANSGASDDHVTSENVSNAELAQVLGVKGLPTLETDATSLEGAKGTRAGASARGLASRAAYVKTPHEKLPYIKGSAKAQTALWTALRNSDATGLGAALDSGAEVNEPNRRGVTALMAAAKANQSQLVTLLLSRGANLESTDPNGATALFYAIEGRSQECADLLLQAAANPNATTVRGETPLNRLCSGLTYLKASPINAEVDAFNTVRRQKLVDLAVSLLCHGADPNLAPLAQPMPLAVAARNGDLGMVQLLLSSGADATGGGASMPDARAGRWQTPLAAVLGAGNRARLEELFLSDGGLINESLRTDLRDAAQKNDLAIVQALLTKGAQVGEGMDRFALLEASASSSAGGPGGELVRLLAQNGASPLVDDAQRRFAFNENLGDNAPRFAENETVPLVLASFAGNEFEPQLSGRENKPASVITRDESPRAVSFEGQAPLVAATPLPQNSRLSRALPALWNDSSAKRAASVSAPQLTLAVSWRSSESVASGQVAPHFAASAALTPRNSSAVEVIEAVGNANVECRTDAGRLFMRLAQPDAPRMAASLLSTVSAAKMSPLNRAQSGGITERASAIKAQDNFDAHYGAPQGYTPLIQAARSGQVETVQALLEGGADPNTRDREGKTALMHLCGAGRAAWVRQLPRRRAEALVGISDSDPRAASRVVSYTEKRQWRQWAEEGDIAMVQALIQAGADVNGRDRDGRTPLMYAARRSSPGVIRALIAAGANINAQDRVGKTAIMQIIGGGRVAAASSWISPLLEREAQHAVAVARGGNLELTQKAIDARSRFELHRDLVKQEAERDDDIILCELRRARANTGLRDIKGHTVLDMALAAGQQNAVRWLMGEVY